MSFLKSLNHAMAICLSVAVTLAGLSALPLTKDAKANAAGETLTVGQNGTYRTVSEAVTAAAALRPSGEDNRITIAIQPGTYREQIIINTPYLTFTNSNPNAGTVVLTWYYGIGYRYYSCDTNGYYNAGNAAAKSGKNIAARWGTAVRINSAAKYFRAENIVFENSFNRYMTKEEVADGVEPTGETLTIQRNASLNVTTKTATERAAACCVEADYAEFYNCSFLSSQDTLYTSTKAYFKTCKIQGNTDYIFGSGDVVFDNCELCFGGYSDKAVGGYITAARQQTNGYLFWNCNVTANSAQKVGAGCFGRPWRDTAHVLFYQTKLQYEGIIQSAGWTSMSGVDPSQATFREYQTTANGSPVNTSGRTNGTVLSVCNATREAYFGGWTPYYFTHSGTTDPQTGAKLVAELNADRVPAGTYDTDYVYNDAFTIRANRTDAVITVDSAAKASDDGAVNLTQRLKMGGAGDRFNRSIQIAARNEGTLKVYMMSSNSADVRTVHLLQQDGTPVETKEGVTGTGLSAYTFSIPATGYYYLTSAGSGINIYYAMLYQVGDDEELPDPPSATTTTTTSTTTTTTTTETTTLASSSLLGDVNQDHKVDIGDVILLNRFVAEDTTCFISKQGQHNADCTLDGLLTADDAGQIMQFLARLLPQLGILAD